MGYEDGTCIVLPGHKGYELEKEYTVSQWAFRSDRTSGIDYEFMNPVTGVIEMRVLKHQAMEKAYQLPYLSCICQLTAKIKHNVTTIISN